MKVLILGAGIIGMASASALLRRNHHVIVVDRESTPGRISSYMNGGQFSYTYAEPLASPALLRQLPFLLLGKHGALTVNNHAFPELLPWGIRFLRNCTSTRYIENTKRVLRLARLSREEMGRYLSEQNPDFDFRTTGKLHLYRDPATLQRVSSLVKLKNLLGFGQEIWNAQQCRAAEPALQCYPEPFAGGVFSPLDQSGDTFKLIQALQSECRESGRCEFRLKSEVYGIRVKQADVTSIQTSKEVLSADAYILSAGTESSRLLRNLGVRLPIIPVKGYSITVPALPSAPEINLTDTHNKIVFTKLGDKLRVAGMMEFAGRNPQICQERVDHLLRLAKKVLPSAGDYSRPIAYWAGLRPLTPDGVPIIGPTQWRNLWLNTGHGMLGSTLSLGSARLIADLLDGGQIPIERGDYQAERFERFFA